MLQSKLFSRTKKKSPKDAEIISHQYLIRGDFIDQSFSGVYRFLPLGLKVLENIKRIIREEMVLLGAQELYLPILQNKKLWLETGRWNTFDPPLFKFKDRHGKEMALGPTHEEEITDLIRHRVSSYQDLPLYLFQIQNKFRNEMRATGGLLRTLEFSMKDLYSFHMDQEDLKKFYDKVKKSYFKIFSRCGLKPIAVEADSGAIGGDLCHEFMVPSPVGEDKIWVCSKCGYGANIEKRKSSNCPQCRSKLSKVSSIELGHVFNLGTKYSQAMKAEYLDKKGQKHSIAMGCYGIGVSRLIGSVVEINHDEHGIIWPEEIAPFRVHLIPVRLDKISKKIYQDLSKAGIDILYDDRDKSVGEKFADADLIGAFMRVVVSEKTLAKKSVEIKRRKDSRAKLVKLDKLLSYVK